MHRVAMNPLTHSPEQIFWQAFLNRDVSFDGKVIIAVKTTKIYCRPSCPAKSPKRENVVFFRFAELAREAGFRACKRCRPDDATPRDPQLDLVREICAHIQQRFDEAVTLQTLSERFHISSSHLQRVFKGYTGISPQEFVEACRMRQLKRALKDGVPITDAIYNAGFGSNSRVYEKAAPQIGMTPRQYQKNGVSEMIRYTIIPCSLGQMLVAATERGVCAVQMGDDAQTLEQNLKSEFSAAHVARDDHTHREWANAILDLVLGNAPHVDLPLDVRATAFQKQVWNALQRIPRGETRTYADVAQMIGQPSAVRAVANACGANPTALVVPCHRVVRTDGSLGGYHWGVERKRKLLANEKN
jgi:AraC family transcriptional regulator of adaptative response/methylated-DNA-[protein]-cysteine methyltransferase